MKRPAQKQLALWMLEESIEEWLPAWRFVGEGYIRGEWHLLSYSVPKRLSELFYEGEVERKLVKGRSGSRYYSYRIKT